MDDEAKDKFVQELVAECSEVVKSNPDNRCAKYCKEYLESDEGKGLDAKGKYKVSFNWSLYSYTTNLILTSFLVYIKQI